MVGRGWVGVSVWVGGVGWVGVGERRGGEVIEEVTKLESGGWGMELRGWVMGVESGWGGGRMKV